MEIKIKNVKHSEFSSLETHCFQATVYIDGKRAFEASNDGNGGSDNYFPLKGQSQADTIAWVEKINAVLGKEVVVTPYGSVKNNLEIAVGELVNQWLKKRIAKIALKKITYIGKDSGLYALPAKIKPTPENLKRVQETSWWKSSYRLLNIMPIEEAMKFV